MATNIPAGLKSADIAQYASRAAQLEKFKPVIAYWCEYYIIKKILDKGLHTTDDESMTYTTTLMDKLEQTKTAHPDDAITDDLAAKVYVEQFASETLQRAEKAMSADKVTAQTADTFRASATFFELLNVWDKLDAETESKIKFAKFHALRIVKALKAGEDPNSTNPKPEPTLEDEVPPLDPNDPEVQKINAAAAHQPTVEDESLPTISPPPAPNGLPSAAAQPPVSPLQPTDTSDPSKAAVSPIEPSPANERAGSVGGGYFPEVPTFTSEPTVPNLPTAPPEDVEMKSPGDSLDPNVFYSGQASTGAPPALPQAPSPAVSHIAQPAPAPTHHAAPAALNSSSAQGQGPYRTDDEATMLAQKHARWAISALNFEDVNTAVKELRNALRALGAG